MTSIVPADIDFLKPKPTDPTLPPVEPVPGGDWERLARDLPVTLAPTQVRSIEGLILGRAYTVAVRYRRGNEYGVGYESENPDDWPESSRQSFSYSPPGAAFFQSVEWTRTAIDQEIVRLVFDDALPVGHRIYRRLTGEIEWNLIADETTLMEGVTEYVDDQVLGERQYDYRVVGVASGREMPQVTEQGDLPVAPPHIALGVYTGPPAPFNVRSGIFSAFGNIRLTVNIVPAPGYNTIVQIVNEDGTEIYENDEGQPLEFELVAGTTFISIPAPLQAFPFARARSVFRWATPRKQVIADYSPWILEKKLTL